MVSNQTEFPDRELRLGEIVFAFLQAAENGQPLDRRQLLDCHPEFASDLTEFFADQDRVQEFARPLEEILQAPLVGDTRVYGPTVNLDLMDYPLSPAGTEVRQFGDYEVVEKLGQGGMGIVYKARHLTLRRVVALKLILAGHGAASVDVQRFHNEAEAVANLDHPHIVPIYEHGEHQGHPYFTMKLVGGGSLAQHLAALAPSAGPGMPPRDATRLLLTVARAVHYAHQHGILHRDLKPANILLDHLGQPHVTDFGLAKRLREGEGDSELTLSGAILGTPSYMAPEQATGGKGTVTTATDVYGLGATLYAALTGRAPFQADSVLDTLLLVREQEAVPPSRGNPAVDRDLDTICLKCLQKVPGRRYASAEALAQDLEHYLLDEPVQACPPSAWYRFRKFARRKKAALALVASLALMLAVLAGSLGWVARDRASRRSDREREAERALADARQLQGQSKWPEALAAAQQARGLVVGTEISADLRQRIDDLQADLVTVLRLEEIHGQPVLPDYYTGEEQDAAYAKVFRDYGIAIEVLGPEEAAERIRSRGICQPLAMTLDDWARLRKRKPGDQSWKKLVETARAADPDEWRTPFRDALLAGDRPGLERLAESVPIKQLSPGTLLLLGNALMELGALDKGMTLLRNAQQQYPGDLWLNDTLGAINLWSLKPPRYDDALRYYTAALAVRPDNWRLHKQVGEILYQKRSLNASLAAYSRAIELRPGHSRSWSWRAMIHLELGHPDEALADHAKAIELDPQDAGAWNVRGVAYRKLHQYDKALADFSKAIELKPDYAEAWWGRAFCYKEMKEWQKAIADYSESLRLDSTNADVHNGLAWLLATCPDTRFRDGRRALELAKRAVELAPTQANNWNTLGVAHYRAGDWKAAGVTLQKSIELDKSGNAYDWFFLAMTQGKLDQQEDARKSYDRAVQWMEKNQPRNEDLRCLRKETAELLGVK